MRKLPHVTVLFWILKTIAVTLGETGADLFGITLEIGFVTTAIAFLIFFAIAVTPADRGEAFPSGAVLDPWCSPRAWWVPRSPIS
ncbi:MAG TPA: hypothetical protein VIQ30_21360 [Pseudonocardia sp.]